MTFFQGILEKNVAAENTLLISCFLKECLCSHFGAASQLCFLTVNDIFGTHRGDI